MWGLLGLALAPAALFPATPLKDGTGAIFCPKAGCSVTATLEGGGTRALAAGTRVRYLEDDAMAGGDGEGVKATIELDGKKATVPNVAVITEERLARAPGGAAAVFTVIESCGDFCHSEIWVIGGARAVKLADADSGPDAPQVAWSPDGRRVAVGTWVLHVVELPGLALRQDDSLVAPAFAPDGALYARDHDTLQLVAVAPDGGKRKLGKVPRGKAPATEDEMMPSFPSPPRFEDGGRVVVVTFERAKGEVVTKIAVGAPAATPPAPPAPATTPPGDRTTPATR